MSRDLVASLDNAWRHAGDVPLCVGFSGGRDSTVLLHVLAGLRDARRSLRALHVDHGLHPDSAQWAARCDTFCRSLDVSLEIVRVRVQPQGEGLEAAARQARQQAFADHLAPDECLATAHHRDDQAETVLLKLLRGAGPHGLGGMRDRRPLGRGWLWRPLLEHPRADLAHYAREHRLPLIEDPSNADPALARSYLRNEILPALGRHWPEAPRTLARAARMQRDVADYLDRQVRAELDTLLRESDASLDATAWRRGHAAIRPLVLLRWLHARGLPAPTEAQRRELERQIDTAAADRVPRVDWPGAEVRLWRGRLYALPPLPPVPRNWEGEWNRAELVLPGAAGLLHWGSPHTSGAAPPSLKVKLGVPGLRFRPAGDRHTRDLRDLFQQAAIPPWRRRRCPALFAVDGTLLAVADLWSTEAGASLFTRLGARPCWRPGC